MSGRIFLVLDYFTGVKMKISLDQNYYTDFFSLSFLLYFACRKMVEKYFVPNFHFFANCKTHI